MKVLCKKNFEEQGIIFIKNKWYSIIDGYETHDDNNKINSYFIKSKKNYGMRFILSNFIEKTNFPRYRFNEYFYTLQEIRKIKLQNLSNESSM